MMQTHDSEREVHVTCECDRGCVASWDLPPTHTLVFDLLFDHRQNKPNMKDNGALPTLTPGAKVHNPEIKLGRN